MQQVNILVVSPRPHMPDVQGRALQRTLQEDLHLTVQEVRTAALYTIDTVLPRAELLPLTFQIAQSRAPLLRNRE